MQESSGTVVVTGANRGIGLALCKALVERGRSVVMMCRDAEAGAVARKQVQGVNPGRPVQLISLDLADLESVKKAAKEVCQLGVPLAALVNNAAILPQQRRLSSQGFELQFAVNHLGHFALTHGLMEALEAAESSRVVTLASMAHFGPQLDLECVGGPGGQSEALGRYRRIRAYQQSKLANVQFALALARRLEGTKTASLAVHPGVFNTGLLGSLLGWGRFLSLFLPNANRSVAPLVRLAVGEDAAGINGGYFSRSDRVAPSPEAASHGAQERLWARSREWTGLGPP